MKVLSECIYFVYIYIPDRKEGYPYRSFKSFIFYFLPSCYIGKVATRETNEFKVYKNIKDLPANNSSTDEDEESVRGEGGAECSALLGDDPDGVVVAVVAESSSGNLSKLQLGPALAARSHRNAAFTLVHLLTLG